MKYRPKLNVRWAWIWASLAVLVLCVETWALISDEDGDTLSEQVTWAIDRWPALFGGLLAAFFGWLIYHWFVEKRNDRGGGNGP